MTGITDLWLFVLAGVMLNLTPGPDMAFVMGQSARLGWRGGAAAALGVGAGCFAHIIAAAVCNLRGILGSLSPCCSAWGEGRGEGQPWSMRP